MAKIDQRKYLKKYLEDDHSDHRKKRKREHTDSRSGRVKIIDDDADYSRKRNYEEDNDLLLTGEDAPQVVGVIDDRPPELKTMEDFRGSSKWKSVPSSKSNVGEKSRNDNRYVKDSSKHDRRRSSSSGKDLSPQRPDRSETAKRRSTPDDYSPPRRKRDREPKKSQASVEKDLSPVRRRNNKNSDDDLSPVRKNKTSDKQHRSQPSSYRDRRDDENSGKTESKMDRTLDGKRAGLQDAKMLKKETDEFRRREDELFRKMSNDVSGRNADVVVREKRSGRVRDLEKEHENDKEKLQREKERKESYSRWGKGLKQVEDYRTKISDEMHESNKPLARYSDDADLDRLLKDKERIGDPMLDYMRQKSAKASNGPKMPTYNGPFPENRFNIRPGYRWDGVDRSNGYEKKWFDVQNSKEALKEEAYKYSTEDM